MMFGLSSKFVSNINRGFYEVRNGNIYRKKEFKEKCRKKKDKNSACNNSIQGSKEEIDFRNKHPIEPELKTWNGDGNNIAVQLNEDYYTRYLNMRNKHIYHPMYHPTSYNNDTNEK
jgi:hypothetical protein